MKIPVNLTIQQLKKIVKKAEENLENKHFADDIITFHVEPANVVITQPVQEEEFGTMKSVPIFNKPINTTYTT